MSPGAVLPSATSYSVGTPEGLVLTHKGMDYAAGYPARTFPGQRFAPALAGRDA